MSEENETSVQRIQWAPGVAARRDLYRSLGAWNHDTLSTLFQFQAAHRSERVAVVDSAADRSYTYGELARDVGRFAAYLRSTGVVAGDTVSVQLPNSYAAVVADLAAMQVGAVLNPLLPNYRSHELRHILDIARTRVIVTPSVYRSFDHAASVRELRRELPLLHTHVVVSGDTPSLSGGEISWDEVLARPTSGTETDFSTRPPDTVSEIIFTSGTESEPKAVMHAEAGLCFAIRKTRSWLEMGDDEVVWMPSPVGHSTGLNFGIRLAAANGYTLVLQDVWNPRQGVELINRYGCTFTLASSTFLSDIVAVASEQNVSLGSLRLFCCGGAPVPSALVEAAEACGIGVLRLYGSTETLLVSWTKPDADHQTRVAYDGALMSDVDIQVWGEFDEPLPDGQRGELVARSAATSVGFAFDEARSARTFHPDGWVRSGDVVIIEDGMLRVVGRKKEIIIRGGMNIAPREIEDELAAMNGIRAVAVLGVPDERLGEIACACIVPASADNLFDVPTVGAYLTERGVARYKHPERVEVIDALPLTPSGKVQKHVLFRSILGQCPS